jgi:acid phosphatase type 7
MRGEDSRIDARYRNGTPSAPVMSSRVDNRPTRDAFGAHEYARHMRAGVTLLIIAGILVVAGLGYAMMTRQGSPSDGSAGPTLDAAVLVGAGDIAECPTEGDEATARVLDDVVADHPDAVVYTTGDNAYPDGSYEEYLDCYDPSWGRHRDRTRPAVGNHEFKQTQASGYHEYWGERGGEFDKYYYSYDVGSWHVVVLNSDCHRVGCEPGSEDGEQADWLIEDLEASGAACTVAIWHHPRWSSGRYGNDDEIAGLWTILYEHGAEIVLNGHEHLYERFAPLRPDGTVDEATGIRQFTVGTGGGNLREFEDIQSTSEARGSVHGVLKLTLYDDRYDWEFLPVDGESFTDRGSATCH